MPFTRYLRFIEIIKRCVYNPLYLFNNTLINI